MALPKESYSPRQILVSSKGTQLVSPQYHTPNHPAAEQKSISVSQPRVSPRVTRSMTRQVRLFDECADSVLLVAQCDDHFYSLHFDDGIFPSQHYGFQVSDNTQPTDPSPSTYSYTPIKSITV